MRKNKKKYCCFNHMFIKKPNNTKNKVCILTSVHPPFDIRIFHKEAKSLVKAGYDVMLVAQRDKDEIVDGIRIVPLPKPKNRLERMTRTVWTAYRKALEIDADVYHFHDPELIPVGLFLKARGKKVIYDVHEDYPKAILSKDYLSVLVRRLTARVFEIFEELAAKYFSGIVPATPWIAQRFERLNKNTVTVQNFPIFNELHIGETVPWKKRSNAVAYVGGIGLLRGAREMVEAIGLASEKTDVRLILAGDFSPQLFKEKVESMAGWKQTEYLGYLSRDKVAMLFGRIKAGLVLFHPEPNHISAQPNKLFEYMSAGIPVIASDFPLWREIVEGVGCGLLVNPLKPEEIADAVVYLLENPEEAEEMGKKGRKAVEEKYNWEMEEKKLLGLYDEIRGQKAEV